MRQNVGFRTQFMDVSESSLSFTIRFTRQRVSWRRPKLKLLFLQMIILMLTNSNRLNHQNLALILCCQNQTTISVFDSLNSWNLSLEKFCHTFSSSVCLSVCLLQRNALWNLGLKFTVWIQFLSFTYLLLGTKYSFGNKSE